MQTGLAGRVALVTGASAGLGRRFAEVLAEHGARVAIAARRADRLESLAAELRAAGAEILPLAVDIASLASVRNAAATTEEKLGPIEILVNNAGISRQAKLQDVDEADYDAVMDTNLKGAFFLAQAAARQMIAHGIAGRIVNIASVAAFRTLGQQGTYCISKAGMVQMTHVMAREWGRHGINTNAVCPGYIATEMAADFLQTEAGQRMVQSLPRRRMGEPRDLDGLILLLCSAEASGFINGAIVNADDGFTRSDPAALNELGNLLMQRGEPGGAAGQYRAALATASEIPELHYNLANALVAAGDTEAALAAFAQALVLNPGYADAHNNLGNLLRRLHRPGEALESYRRALYLNPHESSFRYNFGTALLDLHRCEEAVTFFEQAARAATPHAPAFASAGEALLRLGRAEEALEWFRAATQLSPQDTTAQFGLGVALLTLGRLAEAWPAFEGRLADTRIRGVLPEIGWPHWYGTTDVAGRTMLLIAEQGMGDTIQFARYAPLLRRRGARVVLQAHRPLLPLLRGLADAVIDKSDTPPPFDLYCPMMSLPRAFATTVETIPWNGPYLAADADRVRRWRQALGRSRLPRIGIACTGNPEHMMDRFRSIPAADIAPLLAARRAQFHLLHKEVGLDDGALAAQQPALRLHGEDFGDFADTAALIALLDLVITVDTAVAHLAGAMGKPVWILLPLNADFRWMQRRPDSPWYPSARLFRQSVLGDWQSVLGEVAAALRTYKPDGPHGHAGTA